MAATDIVITELRDRLECLAEMEFIVPDGTWLERFVPGLAVPDTAAQTAREAILDKDYGEVLYPTGILIVLFHEKQIPRPAVAAALREVWLDFGLSGDTDQITGVFREALDHAPADLMTPSEQRTLDELPEAVTIYRGQLFSDGADSPTGMSWTLSREVAEWYAAPVPDLDQPQGWVISAQVPKTSILALFQERDESEVVVDLSEVREITSSRGVCPQFPERLSQVR